MMSILSVIVPIYGVEKYIERCAESLFAQTLKNIEFIFVDDCTLDRSMEVLLAVVEKYRFHIAEMHWTVRTERMPQNSGLAAVRRYGVGLATGEYLIHCDSDDWLEHDAYSRMYEEAVAGDCDMVFCNFYKSSDTNKTVCSRLGNIALDKETILKAMLCDQLPSYSIWSVMLRRSLYEGVIHPTGSMSEDWCAVFQLLFLSNGRLGYVKAPLYNYYVNTDSMSFNPHRIKDRQMVEKRIRNCRQTVDNCEIVFNFIERQGSTARYAPYYVNTKMWAKRLLCRMSDDKEVFRLWRSIYPEIEGQVLLNRFVTLKNKLMYLAMRFRIYPYMANLLLK